MADVQLIGWKKSTKNVLKSPKYFFMEIGVVNRMMASQILPNL